ncbi:dapper homolog 1-like isoform X3 [Scyliorhinus torazame]|uniref:dapper homolog 1-like isoform X3 n=1 Tax=Scyliorhinus torazame TaxID=75743 RepID=UPI003B5B7411
MLPAFSLPASLDRSRHRERLEASLAGLLELQLLRHRQQYLVQEALQIAGAADPPSPLHWDLTGGELNGGYPVPGDTGASSLRRHLNGLRRQELAFVTPLQQLERQVNDLRLEATQTSGGEPETDSRPSSGFYEFSEGPSPALSDSSASIFAECFSNFQSAACNYPRIGLADARINYANERPKSLGAIGPHMRGEGVSPSGTPTNRGFEGTSQMTQICPELTTAKSRLVTTQQPGKPWIK